MPVTRGETPRETLRRRWEGVLRTCDPSFREHVQRKLDRLQSMTDAEVDFALLYDLNGQYD